MKKSFHKDRQNAAQQGRMVQKQASIDFLDPAHEWRRIFAETWGTFLLFDRSSLIWCAVT